MIENLKTVNNLNTVSNPYEAIFNDSHNNDIKIQDKLSPYLNANKKANSYPEMNSFYPSFSVADEIKKESNEIINRGQDDNKSIFINNFIFLYLLKRFC